MGGALHKNFGGENVDKKNRDTFFVSMARASQGNTRKTKGYIEFVFARKQKKKSAEQKDYDHYDGVGALMSPTCTRYW